MDYPEDYAELVMLASWPARRLDVSRDERVLELVGSEDGEPISTFEERTEGFTDLTFHVIDGMTHYDWTDGTTDREINKQGTPSTRPMDETRAEAVAELRNKNLMVMRLDETGGKGKKRSKEKRAGKSVTPKAKAQELVIFTRQLATMVGAGLSLLESLDVLGHQAESPGMKRTCEVLVTEICRNTGFPIKGLSLKVSIWGFRKVIEYSSRLLSVSGSGGNDAQCT